ncbi:hypothetical protein PC116_g34939 [Phytophthora cactorum]|nr:hypothetical protein PC116_g34939 [Phytophthora cactorum]
MVDYNNVQMKTWPTAPHAANPSTSAHTLGCRAMNPIAASSSPAPPATSTPSHSPAPVRASQGLSTRYAAVTAVLMRLFAHIICGPEYGWKAPKM